MSAGRARRGAVLAIVAVALLTGCGTDDDGGVASGGDAETPVTSPSTDPAGSPPAAGARLVEPAPGLDNVVPTAIESAVVVDDTTVEVRFYNGVEPCYGVDHATVEESPTEVIVEVGVGSNPAAGDVACIEIAELQAVRLTLAGPLGDRAIVDASTGQPVPATTGG